MPILLRKEHFFKVNGYPEGNLRKDSDIFSNKIALPNEEQVPGDKVLIKKLATIGIKHQTAFNSIVYHFQCGEQDSEDKVVIDTDIKNIAFCDNLSFPIIEKNKILSDYLVNNIPGVYLLNTKLLKTNKHKKDLKGTIKYDYPKTKIIIQNANFFNLIYPELYTICFLEDDHRKLRKRNTQEEINLRYCNKRVTDSIEMAILYSEYEFEIISAKNIEKWKELIEKSSIEITQFKERQIKKISHHSKIFCYFKKFSFQFRNILINNLFGQKYWVLVKLFTKHGIKKVIRDVLVATGFLKYIKKLINIIK